MIITHSRFGEEQVGVALVGGFHSGGSGFFLRSISNSYVLGLIVDC